MKEVVIKILKKALKEKGVDIDKKEIANFLEVPPKPELGDYAFPCYFLTEKLKDNPSQIAMEIRQKIGNYPKTDFEDIQTKGPYINFFFNRTSLARRVVWDVTMQKGDYGKSTAGKRKKVVVEFSSPNIAKPLAIGNLRSTIIGNSIANLLDFQGFNVKKINYLGDWGTQFGKILFAYDKWGNEKKLEKNPMKHLLDLYVKANKKKYEKKAREWFRKLEEGDKKALMLWKLFKSFSLEELKKIYKTFGIRFDYSEAESDYNKKARKIIDELDEKGLTKKSDKALIVDLTDYKLKKVLIEKSDGTTLYATRDLAAAIARHKKHKFSKMIYEVGQEQTLYFKQLFKILELMGHKWARDCIHVDHGLYLNKKRKRFRTRKGKNVFIEDVLEETKKLAMKEIKKREKDISKRELEDRSTKVATAAIIYGDLKNNRRNNIVFDIKKFVSFEGDTGPYILYSYARATSIVKKAPKEKKFDVPKLEDKEVELVKKLSYFPDVVAEATETLNPSLIANYSFQLAQIFNEFYHTCRVIGSHEETFRLALVESFRQVLNNSLGLLGIETIEEM